ncbi:MAG TPA: hypothetical protein VG246_08930 [Acidimicrobiales bacterium]|jgi:hypothetical protein|nr:hypothetical protein [Acidimicrobiales bacterium]
MRPIYIASVSSQLRVPPDSLGGDIGDSMLPRSALIFFGTAFELRFKA